MDSILEDIFNFATLIPRVARLEVPDYLEDVEEMEELSDIREEILRRVSMAIAQATEYGNSFMVYAYLWVDDRQEFLRQFLQYGHVLTAEEIESAGEEGVVPSPPTLAQFKEQVDTYEMLYDEVEQLSVRYF